MGHRYNNNSGMHAIRYTRNSDVEDMEIYHREQEQKSQKETKALYEEIESLETSCVIDYDDLDRIKCINSENNKNAIDMPIYYFDARREQGKKYKVIIWVGYDPGGKDILTGDIVEAGYYIYFTNKLSKPRAGRKMLLFSAEKKSVSGLSKACEISKNISRKLITHYYHHLEIDWLKMKCEKYGLRVVFLRPELMRQYRSINTCTIRGL